MIPPVVDADFLAEHPDAVLVDVRWYLDGRDGFAAYRDGHMPGALWVDLEHAARRHGQPATEGRHPLPTPAGVRPAMSALGISNDTLVVAYDDTGGITAGRLVVMLRMLGFDAAAARRRARGVARPGRDRPRQPPPRPATFTDRPWPADRLADADEAGAAALAGTPVLDARVARPVHRRGRRMVDKRPGHIPGARSAPATDVFGADGGSSRPTSCASTSRHAASTATTDVIAYCGSGVSACINVLAMEHAGLTAPRLYVASWSGWSADPERHAALGM